MKTKIEHPLTGIWYVTLRENRVAGSWKREYEFAKGDWLIDFMPDGSFFETFRGDEKCSVRRWKSDNEGAVSITADPPECLPAKCIFDGGWLYYYDDLPHIPENPAAIVAHHAHTRLGIVGTDK